MNNDKITNTLEVDLRMLGLTFMADHCAQLSAKAARDHIGHQDYLAQLTKGEIDQRHDRSTARRIRNARFPVVKTLDQFSWSWPKKINRMAVQNLYRLQFMEPRPTPCGCCHSTSGQSSGNRFQMRSWRT